MLIKKNVILIVICFLCACTLGIALLISWVEEQPKAIIILNEKTPAPQQEADVNLTFFGTRADTLGVEMIEEILHNFMDRHPEIKIKYEGLQSRVYWSTFRKRMRIEKMDDIFVINQDYLKKMADQGNSQQYLADLSNLSCVAYFHKNVQEQLTDKQGHIWALPTGLSTYALYVNYDLLRDHGQSVPSNLTEFADVCDFFVAKGIVPIVANKAESLNKLVFGKAFYPVMQKRNFREIMDSLANNRTALLNTLCPGIELIHLMVQHGWIDANEVLHTYQTSIDTDTPTQDTMYEIDRFAKGNRPFLIAEVRSISSLERKKPHFIYKVHPFPISDKRGVLVINLNNGYAINAKTVTRQESYVFLDYLMSPANLWKIFNLHNNAPYFLDTGMPLIDQIVAPLSDSMADKPIFVFAPDNHFPFALDAFVRESVHALLNGVDIKSVLLVLSKRLDI